MKKKYLLVGVIAALALVLIGTKTNLASYARTFITQVERQADQSIPTKFEIERIRQEIASLDGDMNTMIRPIAEYKADIIRTRKEIAASQQTIEEKKQGLLVCVKKLEDNPKFVVCGGKQVSAEKYKAEVQRQTDLVKALEKNLKTQQQVLEAKEKSFKATQEQLEKVIAKQREYVARLADLEALDQSLQVARIASDIKIDTSRTTQIEDALKKLEHKLETDRHELDLRTGQSAKIDLFEHEPEPFDAQAVRAWLEGTEGNGKVANSK